MTQSNNFVEKANESDDSEEFSSLEREKREKDSIYSRVNRKPTPHKKKTKQKQQDGQVFTIPVYTDERPQGSRRRDNRGEVDAAGGFVSCNFNITALCSMLLWLGFFTTSVFFIYQAPTVCVQFSQSIWKSTQK